MREKKDGVNAFCNTCFALRKPPEFLAQHWNPEVFEIGVVLQFLYCVLVSFVTGWTTPKQCSSMSMMGPVHCELGATLNVLSHMTRCMACLEMLPDRCGEISQVDHRGGMDECVVGLSLQSLSGSITLGAGHADIAAGHGRLNVTGRRSCRAGKAVTAGTMKCVWRCSACTGTCRGCALSCVTMSGN